MIKELQGNVDVVSGNCILQYQDNYTQYNHETKQTDSLGPAILIDGILTLAELKEVVNIMENMKK